MNMNIALKKHSMKKYHPLLLYLFVENIGISLLIPLVGAIYLDPKSSVFPEYFSQSQRQFFYGLSMVLTATTIFGSSPLWGRVSDRFGRKPTISIGLIGLALGYAICGLSILYKNFIFLIFGKMVIGFSDGSKSAVLAAFCDTDKETRGLNFRWINIISCLGFLVGPLVGVYLSRMLAHQTLQFAFPLFIMALASTINLGSILWFFRETHHTRLSSIELSLAQLIIQSFKILSDKTLKSIFCGIFMLALGYNILFNYLGLYLVTAFHLTSLQIGHFVTILTLGYLISITFIYPLIIKKMDFINPLILILALSATALILLSYISWLWACLVLVLIAISAMALADTLVMEHVSNQVTEQQGLAMGAMNSIFSISVGCAGLFIGTLSSIGVGAPLFISGLSMVGAILLLRKH